MDWQELWSWLQHIVYPVARWLHIVAVTLLVGGTMFYEWVVPIAIEELKSEQQYTVFGRARWFFRRLVYVSVTLLAVTGAIAVIQMLGSYRAYRPSFFATLAHIILALVGMVIALALTVPGRPPSRPVRWMRINLVVLLIAVFTASVARYVRITLREQDEKLVQRAKDIRSHQRDPIIHPNATTHPAEADAPDAKP